MLIYCFARTSKKFDISERKKNLWEIVRVGKNDEFHLINQVDFLMAVKRQLLVLQLTYTFPEVEREQKKCRLKTRHSL